MTDKLRSYIKPIRALTPDADHRAHKGFNNAIEGSHRPTRKREKVFGRFKGVSETLCMRLSPCEFGGSFVEPFWV